MKRLLLFISIAISAFAYSQSTTQILGPATTTPGTTVSYFIPGFICPPGPLYQFSVSPSAGVTIVQTQVNEWDVTFPSCGVYVLSGLRPCQNFVTGYDTVYVSGYITSNNSFSICQGDSVLINGTWQSNAGTYIDTINTLGCDTILTTILAVSPAFTNTINAAICSGNNYTLPGGNSVSLAGTYIDTLSSGTGCDSIITTNLAISSVYFDSINASICSGNNYILPNGNPVNTSGLYIDTLSTINGCDSIIKVNLTVNTFISLTLNPTICSGNIFTLPDGTTTAIGGNFMVTVLIAVGCDSIITTNLTVNSVYNNSINVSICTGNNYQLPGGNTVSSAGVYNDTLLSINGCDSIIITSLSVVNTITNNQNANICSGQTYTLPNGSIVSNSGNYIDTLTSSGGCDSIITTNLIVSSPIIFNQSATICNGSTYTLPNGNIVNTSGLYSDTLSTSGGCDSIIKTNLSVLQNSFSISNFTVCSKDGYTLSNGNTIFSSGVHKDTLAAKNGCDSIVTINLTVNTSPIITISNDTTIISGTNAILTATGFGNYNWSPSTGLDSTTTNSIIASPTQTTTYCVEVTNTNGCKDTACVTVYVDHPCPTINSLATPNAFSPNGDNLNDEFCLQGWVPCNEEFIITIFNRWGEKVYESKDPNFCWDGVYETTVMEAQVLTYYIKAKFNSDNKIISKKGNITILR